MARIFTVDQAAEYLHVTPYTIRKWLRKGKIPGRKIGRMYRIFEAELEAMLRGQNEHEESLRELAEWRSLSREEKQRRIEAVYADVPFSSDDLIRERREDAEREDRRLALSIRNPSRDPGAHERWLALTQEERDRRVRAARGMFAGGSRTLNDFLREKHEEIDQEERHRQKRLRVARKAQGSESA